MDHLTAHLELIEKQVVSLIKKREEDKVYASQLKQKNESLSDQLRDKEREIEALIEKNKILRIAGGQDQGDTKEIKLKINEIVREVDKCIAQLNQ